MRRRWHPPYAKTDRQTPLLSAFHRDACPVLLLNTIPAPPPPPPHPDAPPPALEETRMQPRRTNPPTQPYLARSLGVVATPRRFARSRVPSSECECANHDPHGPISGNRRIFCTTTLSVRHFTSSNLSTFLRWQNRKVSKPTTF